MTNGYLDAADYTALARNTVARSAAVNAYMSTIVAAFDKLPTQLKTKSGTIQLIGDFGGTATALTCSLFSTILTTTTLPHWNWRSPISISGDIPIWSSLHTLGEPTSFKMFGEPIDRFIIFK